MQVQLSEKQLKSLKEKLLLRRGEIRKQIKKLKENDPFSDPDHAIDNAAVDTDVREEVGHEDVAAKIELLEKNLNEIERALLKIKRGSYGKCERCGKPIPYARLELVPEARYCLDCKRKLKA